MFFDEFMCFNMSLIWRQEEDIMWEKQGMTEIFGLDGDSDGDSQALSTKTAQS